MALFEIYRPRGSWIERIDPRLKLIWLSMLLVITMTNNNWMWLVLTPLIVISSSLSAGMTARSFYLPLAALSLIASQILIVQLLFCRQGYPLFHFGILTVYSEALSLTVNAALRLAGMVLASMQFITWTSPMELTLLLVKARIPYRFAMLAGLAMRFLPLMERELVSIMEIQAVRGLPMDTAVQKLKGLRPVALALLFRAFRRAGETALAMEVRGFGRYSERTFLEELKLSRLEALTMGLMAALISWQLINKI